MTRFRRSGINWEGRTWQVSAPIELLATMVEKTWPDKHPTDGTVASQRHDANNPRSDHRPKPVTGPGIVRAIDIGEVIEDQGETLTELLRASRDPRIRYVIHEGRLFSSYDHSDGPAWEWRPYRGGNEHLDHVHVSILATADTDARPFAFALAVSSWAQRSWEWAKGRFSWSSGPQDVVTVEMLMVLLRRYHHSKDPE